MAHVLFCKIKYTYSTYQLYYFISSSYFISLSISFINIIYSIVHLVCHHLNIYYVLLIHKSWSLLSALNYWGRKVISNFAISSCYSQGMLSNTFGNYLKLQLLIETPLSFFMLANYYGKCYILFYPSSKPTSYFKLPIYAGISYM